ncbi:MAG TPA: class I SAM-dependent methyltransferase [Solirubrobacteraceae bacterium]|nr:class I SAM-dependent methyltransferase [Solirubrobacteraceae bacterium]
MLATDDAAKLEAVRQWTADPCGPEITAPTGTREAVEQLLAGRRAYAPWLADTLAYRATAGLDVLDVGCGQGIDLIEYAGAGARATGIDLTPRHVELARRHLQAMALTATVVQGDAERLPFEDSSFDVVSSNGVLHHTPDMGAALSEIHRVLRPGGTARIVVYNRRSIQYWAMQVAIRGILQRGLLQDGSMAGVLAHHVETTSIGARPLVRVYSRPQLRRMLLAAGFAHAHTSVHGFNVEETPISLWLARNTRLLDSQAARERIGRTAGWYVAGVGQRGR